MNHLLSLRILAGPDKGAYYHECFQRGYPSLAYRMTRCKVKKAQDRFESKDIARTEQQGVLEPLPFEDNGKVRYAHDIQYYDLVDCIGRVIEALATPSVC